MPRIDLDRRSLLQGAALTGAAGLATRTSARSMAAAGQVIGVVDLRVNHLESPLIVETAEPRLSWQNTGAPQAAYRILVARNPALLTPGRADLWDSGKVAGTSSFDVAYGGQKLRSRERAYWRVELWDPAGSASRSDVAYWQMGLLQPEDWVGTWLAAESEEIAGDRAAGLSWIWAEEGKTKATQLFRRRFEVTEALSGAVLQVVARDSLDGVWLNGKPVERQPFRPGVVNNARMETIRLPVRQGSNDLRIAATYRPERGPVSPTGGFAAVIRIEHAGSTRRITTRSGWEVAPAATPLTGKPLASAKWLRARAAGSKPEYDPWAAGPAMLLRRRFAAASGVVRATLYATALGAYYVHLNGRRVGEALLAPEPTDFLKRVQYQAYDVSDQLRVGDNMFGAIVGDGWYGSTGLFGGRYDFGSAPNRFLAQLVIDYADGTSQMIPTDSLWETAPSPILVSEIYDGEIFDARLVRADWDLPGGSTAGWRPVVRAERPVTNIAAQPTPPIRITRTLNPVAVRQTGPDSYVLDFGQNMAGWCALTASAPAGTTVTLRFAEILKPSGEIDQSNLRSAEARDVYTFAGAGRETYRPHFTYHGFRYVSVEGWRGPIPKDFLVAEVLHTDLDETGLFRIDDPLVQKLWLNTLWSQRSNFVGLPTDCPQRDERLGWLGDAHVFWDAASFNMDVASFTTRFMRDVRDAQEPSGAFPEYAPQSTHAKMKGAPGWADAGIVLPWTNWQRFGDTAIISENWDAMSAFSAYVMRHNPDFIWRNKRGTDFGDWLALDAKEPGDPTTPKDLVGTAMWANSTRKMAEMAEATGRATEAKAYRERLNHIARAFASEFQKADGRIGNGSQTGYLLALHYGLVPASLRSLAASHLVADIRRRGNVLSTGFLGTPVSLDVLLDVGQRDLVYSLLRRTEFPSWGYMVAKGATTIWERWNGDTGDVAMNSFNHYALGAIIGFFYRRLAGIDAAQPGFSSILIAPETRLGFKKAGATYDSRVGRIETDWTRAGGTLLLNASIPVAGTGLLKLPVDGAASATINGKRVAVRDGIVSATLQPGKHVIRVVS